MLMPWSSVNNRWWLRSRLLLFGSMAVLLSAAPVSSESLKPAGVPVCPTGLFEAGLSDAAIPIGVPEMPCGEHGSSRYVFAPTKDGKILPVLVEGPRGPQVRTTASYQQLKARLAAKTPVPSEWQMTRDELVQLVDQLDTVRDSTEKYRDINMAMADGYIEGPSIGEVPGMGVHFRHMGRWDDGLFNPAEPEMLLYTRRFDGQWRLMGTAFVVLREHIGDDHPEGFAGPLDNWHVHYNVCGKDRIRTVLEPEACQQWGGESGHGFGWMIHAWVWEENTNGVFSMHHHLLMEHDEHAAHAP